MSQLQKKSSRVTRMSGCKALTRPMRKKCLKEKNQEAHEQAVEDNEDADGRLVLDEEMMTRRRKQSKRQRSLRAYSC